MRESAVIESAFDEAFDEEISQLISTNTDLTNPEAYIDNEIPVDIIQLVDDPYYLGGQVQLQNAVKDVLWDIEDPGIREVDFEIGKGSGKSEICSLSQIYGAYVISRLKYPQKFFGLADATIIAAVNVSIGREQAKDVVFQSVKKKIEASPYFQSLSPVVLAKEIVLPNNIHLYCGHSGDKAWLGYATIRGVMDEVNYMFDNQSRNVAKQLYDALHGSMLTRFKDSYKLVSVSSVTLPTTWLHTRVVQALKLGDEYIQRIRDMEMEVLQRFPDGRQMVKVSFPNGVTSDQVIRTLAQEHGLETLNIGEQEALPISDSQGGREYSSRTVEVRANNVIDGI